MKKKPNALRKFLSFSRWQRRFGAKQLKLDCTSNEDYHKLKTTIIDQGQPILSRGSAKDITEHYSTLRQEFSGKPELCFHHAMLIVMIRREVETESTFKKFENLWIEHGEWLLENLNIRWLVSACDTFADNSKNITERSLALATSLLANTVKVYETEYVMSKHSVEYDTELVKRVQQEAIPLIEGMSCFTVGTDDTLRNMVWRMKDIAPNYVNGRILLEVFQRFSTLPTAFGRLRQSHTRQKTQFWD